MEESHKNSAPAIYAFVRWAGRFQAGTTLNGIVVHEDWLPTFAAAAGGVVAALVTPAIRRYAVKDVLSAAPKAAIEALVRGIAAEEGRFGVRANCVGVGVIEDGMYHKLIETGDFDERFLQATRDVVALRRLGAAQDIANAVEFLVSDRAAYITGQTPMVDGGYAV